METRKIMMTCVNMSGIRRKLRAVWIYKLLLFPYKKRTFRALQQEVRDWQQKKILLSKKDLFLYVLDHFVLFPFRGIYAALRGKAVQGITIYRNIEPYTDLSHHDVRKILYAAPKRNGEKKHLDRILTISI